MRIIVGTDRHIAVQRGDVAAPFDTGFDLLIDLIDCDRPRPRHGETDADVPDCDPRTDDHANRDRIDLRLGIGLDDNVATRINRRVLDEGTHELTGTHPDFIQADRGTQRGTQSSSFERQRDGDGHTAGVPVDSRFIGRRQSDITAVSLHAGVLDVSQHPVIHAVHGQGRGSRDSQRGRASQRDRERTGDGQCFDASVERFQSMTADSGGGCQIEGLRIVSNGVGLGRHQTDVVRIHVVNHVGLAID